MQASRADEKEVLTFARARLLEYPLVIKRFTVVTSNMDKEMKISAMR